MAMDSRPTAEQISRLPKALLHDHLDGGLRTETIIELAEAIGYTKLPTHDPAQLADWFQESCDSGSLVRYLETFSHTIAVMQTREAIERVARECVVDLARDGVVYAEVRGAPELFTEQSLSLNDVVEATVKVINKEWQRLRAKVEQFGLNQFFAECVKTIVRKKPPKQL